MIEQIDSSAFLWLIVTALSSYRITRLIVLDEVIGTYPEINPQSGAPFPFRDPDGTPTEDPGPDDDPHQINRGTGLRRRLDLVLFDDDGVARGPIRRWLGRLLTCSFCVGVWITAAVLVGWEAGSTEVRWVVVAAAVAGGQGFISSRPGS